MVEAPRLQHPKKSGSMHVIHVVAVPFTLRFLRGQAAFMRERGIQLGAISSPGPELEDFGMTESVDTFGIPISRHISPVADLVSIARLVRRFRLEKPDIVHTHTPKGGLLGTIAAWLARVPVRVHTIHGLVYMTSSGRKRQLLMAAERLTCRLANDVLCVSESVRGIAIDDGIVPHSKVKVLGNGSANGINTGVDFNPENYSRDEMRAAYGLPLDAQVVLFVGRLSRDKGISELAQAWASLAETYPYSTLMLAGDVDDRDPVESRVMQRLLSDNRVTHLGHHTQIAELLSVANVLVLPTYREGFPTVLLEASAMAVPIVATDVPGCQDAVVNGVTGTLVPARNATELVRAIASYLEAPEIALAHGQAGRKRVKECFKPSDIVVALAQNYASLVEAYETVGCGASAPKA